MISLFPRLILLTLILIQFNSIESSPNPSIYDQLKKHGLPIGIFPKGITEYTLDTATGFFQINLTRPCNAKFENQLHYDFNISGQLSRGKIGGLSGVTQQELFLWFPVKGIRVDEPSSGLIYFDVGVVDKQFSLSLFENPLDCTVVDPEDNGSGAGSGAGGRAPDSFSSVDSQNQSLNLGHDSGYGGKQMADS